jgi:peptide/nickel transport system substrate-binding protein
MSLFALFLAFALVVAACGDDDADTTAPPGTTAAPGTTEAPPETTEAPPETMAPVEKPTIVVALSDTVNLVEPHTFRSTSAYAVTHAVFEPLIVQEQTVLANGMLESSRVNHVGAGAESYTVELTEDGGTVAVFTIRDSGFQDGTPVTAYDYEYMFKRSLDAPASYIPLLAPFIGITSDSITALDERTLEIRTSVQSPLFERFMTFQVFGALNQAEVEANATAEDEWGFEYLNDKSASSGPYYISEFSPDTQVVLSPNEYYWEADSVANAGVVIRTVPDPSQRAQLVRTGEIDLAAGIPERLIPDLRNDPNVVVYDIPTTGVAYMAMNVNLIDDIHVRQAIVSAVPYQALLDQVMFGLAAPAGGVVTSTMETHDAAVGALYATDLDAARTHLGMAASVPDDLFIAVRQSRAADQEAAVLIQENLRQVGLDVEVQVLPDADFGAKATGGELPMLIQDWFSWGEDPFYQMRFLSTCVQIPWTNFANWCNEDYDALVEGGSFTVDEAERQSFSSQAQQLFYDNAVWAPLWSTPRTLVAGKCVTGVDLGGYSKVAQFQHLSKTEDC